MRQIFDDATGRRWLVLRWLLALGVTGLLVLLALLAHALIAAPPPDDADVPARASDQAQLAGWSAAQRAPLHDSRSAGSDLEMDRALRPLSAVVVSDGDALKYPTRLQALVGQGHAVLAAPFSGRPLDGLTPQKLRPPNLPWRESSAARPGG